MNIRLYKNTDKQAWDDYAYKHPDAYHAHLSGWKNVIEKTYNKKSYYLLAEDNEEIVGILPLFHIKSLLFGNQLVSMPYLTYGGVISDSDEIANSLINKALEISKDLKTDYIELRQVRSLNENFYEREKTQVITSKVSMRLELPKNSEELFKSFKAKLRSQIRRPQKEGMTFTIGGSELIKDFYKVFAVNMRDLGSPVHSKDLFINIFEYFKKSIKLGVIYFNGIPVASGLISLFKDFVEIPWASSIRKYNRYSPNMLLYWSFLDYAINNGFKYFDYGRSTPGEGTYRFKQQWGCQEENLRWYKFAQNANDNFNNNITNRDNLVILALMWSKLPITITRSIGPYIRKSFSL